MSHSLLADRNRVKAFLLFLLVVALIGASLGQVHLLLAAPNDCAGIPGVPGAGNTIKGQNGLGNCSGCEVVDHQRMECPFGDFSGYDFSGLTLRYSWVSDASFANANMQDTDWQGSYLYGSDFTGADLTGANLAHTWLFDSNITQEQLDSTASCTDSLLPAGLVCHNETPGG